MEIDWNEAPADATHCHVKSSMWYMITDSDIAFCHHYIKGWGVSIFTSPMIVQSESFTKRPEPKEKQMNKQDWKEGVDLPPVRETVIVDYPNPHKFCEQFIGKEVEIISHDLINNDYVAVFRVCGILSDGNTSARYHSLMAHCFKKVKTKEQLEAEEQREKAIRDMVAHTELFRSPQLSEVQEQVCTDLYDAGYRKVV